MYIGYIYIYIYIYWVNIYIYSYRAIGIMARVFINGAGDQGLIPGQVIPKTQKMVLDASLLNTLHYKVWIKWNNLGNVVVLSPTPSVL